jgi:hypothetical protein
VKDDLCADRDEAEAAAPGGRLDGARGVGALLQERRRGAVLRRPCAGARKWRTKGAVSIRHADAASAIGSIDPVALMAQAPASNAT